MWISLFLSQLWLSQLYNLVCLHTSGEVDNFCAYIVKIMSLTLYAKFDAVLLTTLEVTILAYIFVDMVYIGVRLLNTHFGAV